MPLNVSLGSTSVRPPAAAPVASRATGKWPPPLTGRGSWRFLQDEAKWDAARVAGAATAIWRETPSRRRAAADWTSSQGMRRKESQCFGRTTPKCLRSSVRMMSVLSRSARETSDASVPPNRKFRYCSTSSAIRSHSRARGACTSKCSRPRRKLASARDPSAVPTGKTLRPRTVPG